GPDAIPFLVEVLKEKKSNRAVIHAANALGRVGAAAKPAVPLLAEALKIDNWELRRGVLNSLADIGKEAAPAIPAIAGVLEVYLRLADTREAEGFRMSKGRGALHIFTALKNIDAEIANMLPKEVLDRASYVAGKTSKEETDRLYRNRQLWEEAY